MDPKIVHTPVEDVAGVVAGARETYSRGVTRPLAWRLGQLRSLRRMLVEQEQAIVDALARDLRRPRAEALILEVVDSLAQCRYFERHLPGLVRPKTLKTPLSQKPLSTQVWKEPFGVVTIIAPWNYPIGLLLIPLIGAIAAGNACIVKPSEVSENCSALLADLIPKYLDNSAVRVVTGGVPQTTALLAEKVNFIVYTGAGEVGKIVMAAASKHLTPVILELGGKSPVYIDESANVQVAARRIVWCKHMNAGQTCVAPDYVLVHEKVRDEFLREVKAARERFYPGEEQKNPDISRIVNDRHTQRIAGLMQGHGGQVILGGTVDKADRFVAFTVVSDPHPDSKLMKEEIFGPILPVLTVKSADEAITFCTNRPTPLAAYVFERDSKVRSRWITEVPFGGGCVNDCTMHLVNAEGGLGGKGESGMGSTRGREMFETFSHRKVLTLQAPNLDVVAKYPPYSESLMLLRFFVSGELPRWVNMTYLAGVAGATVAVAVYLSMHLRISWH